MNGKQSYRFLKMVQDGHRMTFGQQLMLTVQLSIPAIISQLSSILMQFIDASMVGSLGAEASASIGLVSTTTWLFGGLATACATGFYVMVSHPCGQRPASAVARRGGGDMRRCFNVLYDFHTFAAIPSAEYACERDAPKLRQHVYPYGA